MFCSCQILCNFLLVCIQLFENYIKNEIVDRGELVQTLIDGEGTKRLSEPRKSVSIACGATVLKLA